MEDSYVPDFSLLL